MRSRILLAALLCLAFIGTADAAPVQGDAVQTAVAAPANIARSVTTETVTTTRKALIAFASSSTEYNIDSKTQNVTVESDPDNTARICVKVLPIGDTVSAANDTCAEVCLAGTFTCDKTGTDGQWLDVGNVLPLRDTAKFCYCGIAASGTQTYQAVNVRR